MQIKTSIRYHKLFSKGFTSFMKENSFCEIEELGGDVMLHKAFDSTYIDTVNSVPTRSGPLLDSGKYSIRIGEGIYHRKFNLIENENEKRIPESYTNRFFSTLFPKAAKSELYEQSSDGVKIMLKLWKEEIYPKTLSDLALFEDLQNLNILFNYPDIADERAYNELMIFENTGPRGIVRSLIIAREAGDPNYESLLSAHIESYQQMKVEYPHEADVIDTIIKIISAVNVSKPT